MKDVRGKLKHMVKLDKEGRLIPFFAEKQNQPISWFPGQTFLPTLYDEVKDMKNLTKDEQNVVELLKIAVAGEATK